MGENMRVLEPLSAIPSWNPLECDTPIRSENQSTVCVWFMDHEGAKALLRA